MDQTEHQRRNTENGRAQILVDGREIARNVGGYLPFEVDLTDALTGAAEHELLIRVDSRGDPDIPPGKPFDELDFCWYGGLYRDAHLCIHPAVHITNAIAANEVAGGGVFVRTLAADDRLARLNVRTHVRHNGAEARELQLEVCLSDGRQVVATAVAGLALAPGSARHVSVDLEVVAPRLWSPDSPALYELRAVVRHADGRVADERAERVGIRRIAFSRSGGFVVNGRRLRLRGTNRHQEFPRVGYAAPRAAQFRDARRIKEAGFDYVRLSHYPQSPDFLDACDELGIVVMNCLPGWQYLGGERFREACFAAARQMIRRDRNHPSVVLWELSLNETAMDEAFMTTLHAIGHAELPGGQMFTCGWMDRYDIYLRSRQHGQIHTWQNEDKALVIAEYGDWEFYAANEGFDQKTGTGLLPRWSNGRKFRADGERGLRQQAWNHLVALDDTLASSAVLDGQWSMFDYARGYDPIRAACGVMDVFRLPKFSYYFYRSQRHPDEGGVNWTGGAMVFIASHWMPASDLSVAVFSNCDEVELRLNGEVIERLARRATPATQHLPHPPYLFNVPRFTPGTLEATGMIGGKSRCTHQVVTPGVAAKVTLVLVGESDLAPLDDYDLLFAHAELRDAAGTLCVAESSEVEFFVGGDAILVGPSSVHAEAGIASVVIAVPRGAKLIEVGARSKSDPGLMARRSVTRHDCNAPTRNISPMTVLATGR